MIHTASLRVLHWNILKLRKTATNHISHIENISKTISHFDPTICSLCEISNSEQLEKINLKYKYFVKSRDVTTGQNCAMLSNIEPIIKPHIFSKHISKHYLSVFQMGKIKIAMIGCHLYAKPHLEENIKKRELQATELENKIKLLIDTNHQIILAGDINDYDDYICDASNSKPISNVVNIIKSNGKLLNVCNKIEQSNRYTYTFNNNNILIDHVFVTPLLYDLINNVKIHHIKNKINDDSDHNPMIIDFCL